MDIKLINTPVYFDKNGTLVPTDAPEAAALVQKYGQTAADKAADGSIAAGILAAHNQGDADALRIKFDALASHDITYVGIIQTARASGLKSFPIPYVLTNCHNSLCAVGGTINEDDHLFGLSAAQKYGGIYVPAHIAVIHQYMRECMSRCGSMILGSDSHTRYGALGTMAVGEGGPELVKQLLNRTYDIPRPDIVCVRLSGKPAHGVGPQDVALAIIGAVFKNGFVKNSVMEFVGEGIANLPMEFRIGIDVMTTETTCLSSIWATDDQTKRYFDTVGRPEDFAYLAPAPLARYDRAIDVDLSKIRPMIALPFHPSNVYPVAQLKENAADILREAEKAVAEALDNKNLSLGLTDKIVDGQIRVDQGVIAGCAGGTYDNLALTANILRGGSVGNGAFALSLYPASQPVYMALAASGAVGELMAAGATLRTAFCGPCFGAGDVPANGCLSIRHSTRNFPNREGSKPGAGQLSAVALMDARSIAATALNGGILTGADEIDYSDEIPAYEFDGRAYQSRIYNGFGKADDSLPLRFGPNIADWPEMGGMTEDMLFRVDCAIQDEVTTTDELIPSGETSSYRSNPEKLAEFTLSRKDPEYVARAKEMGRIESTRRKDGKLPDELKDIYPIVATIKPDFSPLETAHGSLVFAKKPGDGSAREQAASCQRVLGGRANLALAYATKRYRSNLINWGMLPFITETNDFCIGDYLFVPGTRAALESDSETLTGYRIRGGVVTPLKLSLGNLTRDERDILLSGCLINYYNR